MKYCTFYCLYPEIIEGGILDAQSYKLEVVNLLSTKEFFEYITQND